jgi:hypothetical protein
LVPSIAPPGSVMVKVPTFEQLAARHQADVGRARLETELEDATHLIELVDQVGVKLAGIDGQHAVLVDRRYRRHAGSPGNQRRRIDELARSMPMSRPSERSRLSPKRMAAAPISPSSDTSCCDSRKAFTSL